MGIALAMPIGPVVMEIIRRGTRSGFLSAFLVSLGATVADIFYLIVIFTGIYYFINNSIVQTGMWILGFVILIYLGIEGLRDFLKKDIKLKQEKSRHKNSFIAGMLLGFSSPTAFLWWIGIFGSIMVTANNPYIAMQNGLLITLGIVIWELFLSVLTHYGKKILTNRVLRYVSVVSGIILIYFGLYFGYKAILSIF